MKAKEKEALAAISESLDWLLQHDDQSIRLEVLQSIPMLINLTLGSKTLEKIGERCTATFKLPKLKM